MNGIVLTIFDGWGEAPSWGGNAIAMARKPNFEALAKRSSRTVLKASGKAVGLTGHEIGNSEVGHLNLGAGRVPKLDSSLIFDAIADGSFYHNATLKSAVQFARNHHGTVHVMGLVSDGGVHAHIDHLFALLDFLKQELVPDVMIHAFTDGRDTAPTSAIVYLSRLQNKIQSLGVGTIATVSGRFFAMDRDHHMERTKQAVDAMVNGNGVKADSPLHVVASAYRQGITDEFIPPSVIYHGDRAVGRIKPQDCVIFFNFRQDRARQISQMLIATVPNIYVVGFVPYGGLGELPHGFHSAFTPKIIVNPLSEIIATHGFRQFHIAETEKYAHVTYFFNGGRELPFPGEDRVLVPSLRLNTFDKAPEMQAREISQKLTKAIASKAYKLLVANFANLDMVGHTGNFNATVKAVEVVDTVIGNLIKSSETNDYGLILTADHGNAEEMIDPITAEVNTEHSRNPVPFLLYNQAVGPRQLSEGILADVAPTILRLLGQSAPDEMTGRSLI